jgi:hypothetical protein
LSPRLLGHWLACLAIAISSAACTGKDGANDDLPLLDLDADGFTADAGDCDDEDASIHPDADEICDGIDQDCDLEIDEDPVDAPTFYRDADEDGYGTATATKRVCDASAGYVADNTDCDDAAVGVHPGAEEECDAVDNDCDGTVDLNTTWYVDADGDGFGVDSTAVVACDAPDGMVAEPADCDDTTPLVYPGAPELCDGAPNDCNSASEWTQADEDHMASAHDRATDTWTDVTDEVVGSASAASLYEPDGGTTTWFCPGTYYVHIEMTSDDTWLVGRDGAESTTLDGLAAGLVLKHSADGLRVEGLTVTNGSNNYGGGLSNGGEATVVDCAFTNNTAREGGGIISGGPLTVTGTTFSGNAVEGYEARGGGIYASNTLLVQDCTFTGNTASGTAGSLGSGGGLAGQADFYTMTVERSTFTDNVADLGGGLSSAKMQNVMLVDIVVRGNSATYGGGLGFDNSTVVNLAGSTIAGNTADEGGGAWLGAARLECDTTDWGGGEDDNTPHDIFAAGTGLPYLGTTDTFTCTGAGGC